MGALRMTFTQKKVTRDQIKTIVTIEAIQP